MDSTNMATSVLTSTIPIFLSWSTLWIYCFGFLTFIATVLDHWLNPKSEFNSIAWYFQEFLYTTVAIALGIAICFGFELNNAFSYVVSISMGIVGSSVIRKVRTRKDEFADKVINKVEQKIDEN